MSATANCACPCPDPTIVEIPGTPGSQGDPGNDGTNGIDAFTTLTAGLLVPAIGGSVTAAVVSGSWAASQQIVFISDGTNFGSFRVTTTGSTSLILTYLGYDGEALAGVTIASGTGKVSPGGTQVATPVSVAHGGTNSATATLARAALGVGGASLSVYASGTSYQLTATPAQVVFGTTSPSLTITSAGVWLLLARARVDYTGSTFAAVRTGTLKLRRTNHTAADLANSPASFLTDIITTLTYTLGVIDLAPIIYTTTNNDDIIQVWGSISVVPTAGSIDVSESSIVAVKLYDQTV
jgi:hypothetical protein